MAEIISDSIANEAKTWLKNPALRLKHIMNLARGAAVSDWPLPSELDSGGINWRARWHNLKDYCREKGLPVAHSPGLELVYRHASVPLLVLWEFLQKKLPDEESLDWLRDFCSSRWAEARGETLPDYNPDKERLTKKQKRQRAEKAESAFRKRVETWPHPNGPYPNGDEDYDFMENAAGYLPRWMQRRIRGSVCNSYGYGDTNWLKKGPRKSVMSKRA